MKNIILAIVFLSLSVLAEVTMKKTYPQRPVIEQPIEKPDRPIHRPVRPVIHPGVVYQDNYYNASYSSNCEPYIAQLREKDAQIDALKSELATLKAQAQSKLQKELKSSYEAELEKFENRKSSIKSNNSFTISDKPVEK